MEGEEGREEVNRSCSSTPISPLYTSFRFRTELDSYKKEVTSSSIHKISNGQESLSTLEKPK